MNPWMANIWIPAGLYGYEDSPASPTPILFSNLVKKVIEK